jgi:2-polyprenyl-3-methyl-5-hydroxy-6-metoxy-1,4-benzoquinol methylase
MISARFTLDGGHFSHRYDADGGVPWDLYGRPQPPVHRAAKSGEFGSAGTAILDCGCGAGDNAIFLATCGFDVLGFDLSPSAVATARERAAGAVVARAIAQTKGGAVEIVHASAVELGASSRVKARAAEVGGFERVLDSALQHL